MGQKDIAEKILEDYPEVFADIVNVLLYDGETVVKPEELSTATPVSMYKAGKKLHEQERDIAKYWVQDGECLVLYGLENQTKKEAEKPLRVIGYDGASYRAQLLRENDNGKYPVITLVLYFGKDRWDTTGSLEDILKIPQVCRKYVEDYRIWVFPIAWLSEEEISRFQSDFRVIADFFRQKRIGEGYKPPKYEIEHVDEVLKMLAVITEDERFGELLNSQDQEKRPENMCEIYDMIENKGIEKGIKKGREEGIKEGIKEGREEGIVLGGVRMLCSLVQNNMLTTDRAAEAAGLSVSAFQKRMKEYSQ